jgi:hypothetical protein
MLERKHGSIIDIASMSGVIVNRGLLQGATGGSALTPVGPAPAPTGRGPAAFCCALAGAHVE